LYALQSDIPNGMRWAGIEAITADCNYA